MDADSNGMLYFRNSLSTLFGEIQMDGFLFRKLMVSLFATLIVTACCGLIAFGQETATDDPVALFNLGQDAHEKGKLTEAVELYKKAIAAMPEFPEAEFQLASAYVSLGRDADAEPEFRRALELREDWTLPMVGLGALLVRKGDFDAAGELLEKAIAAEPANSGAYVSLAELRIRTKAPPEQLRPLLEQLKLLTSKANPTAAALTARAALERTLGDGPAAKSSITRALALDPKNRGALAEEIQIALASTDVSGALEKARSLVQLSSGDATSKILLARAQAANGLIDESLKTLDSIPSPTAEVAALRKVIASDSDLSAADVEKMLAADPGNAALNGRLCGMLRTADPTRAMDFCKRAYEIEPSNLAHVIGYAAALVQAKQYSAAVDLLKRTLAVAPDNYTAHANLATALFQLRRYEEAKAEFLWLSEKQPDLAITYYFLAIVHDQLTEYMDAMANYQQFLKLADASRHQLEIDKVNLRLPSLQKQIKDRKGKKSK